MLCVWVYGCDPGRLSDGSRLALYQTLSIECTSIFFWHELCVIVPFIFIFFLFSCSCWSFEDVRVIFFLSGRPHTGLATTYITGYG